MEALDPTYLISQVLGESVPEITPTPPGFRMHNTGGVEVEVGEFLYALVRMCKPQVIFETGTHLGISSSYIALALKRNEQTNKMKTYEIIPELQAQAQQLWERLGVTPWIESYLKPSLQAQLPVRREIDLLFLDSEPQFRFDEFLRFWPRVKDGGLILIHDLHPALGHSGQTYHNMYDWPFGDFRKKIGKLIKTSEIQIMSFPTPRGFTLFQRRSPGFSYISYLRGELSDEE